MEKALINLGYIGLGLYFLFILRFLLLAFKAYDNIFLYEYEHLPDQWEKDGKPRGIEFWKFPKSTWMESYKLATFRSVAIAPLFWIFVIPGWAKGQPEVLRYFGNLRKNVLGWNIALIRIDRPDSEFKFINCVFAEVE